jgi:hypothetical protein
VALPEDWKLSATVDGGSGGRHIWVLQRMPPRELPSAWIELGS